MVKVKEKLPESAGAETVEIVDNGRLKRIPTYINIEATYWEKECLRARCELANANRGISRLVKRKDGYKARIDDKIASQIYAHGKVDGATEALAGSGKCGEKKQA